MNHCMDIVIREPSQKLVRGADAKKNVTNIFQVPQHQTSKNSESRFLP